MSLNLVAFSAALARLAVTLWVGGLWAIGYLAAPVLFASLPSRLTAGDLAGQLFYFIGWIGVACGGYLLLFSYLQRPRRGLCSWPTLALCVMVLLSLLQLFWLQPLTAQIKAEMHSVAGGESFSGPFALWHAVASLAYLGQSLLGAALVATNAFGQGKGGAAPQ